ncbi:hypothetical protein G9A89_004312 [Geosiphon pyriformis]|nr:hypothetical protein G9A89_004312 [Geosiphon pyriformis]
MPEYAHNTDAGFDLKYPGKNAIKLKPHLCTCIDLKVALEISATTMIQLASKSSLVKKEINIKEEIINTRYLVLVKNREELRITAKKIQGFGSMSRINIPVNMAEKKIYILAIKREVKNQVQLLEAKAIICKSGEIGLTNLYISAKSSKNIKILIYNITGNIIEIPKGTIIGYLTTEMLLNNFNDIFANENEFGCTNIIQHQIKTGNIMLIKQRAYQILPASHEIICQEIN